MRAEAVIVASCPNCGGVKGIECENGQNETVQRWIDRGDLIGAEILSVLQGDTDWKCRCSEESNE